MSSMQEQIVQELADKMQSQVDFEILSSILVDSCGWTKVELENKFLPVSGKELHEWRVKNIKGRWFGNEGVWLFEDAKDANWFILKWA